jgi:hypothetical protein
MQPRADRSAGVCVFSFRHYQHVERGMQMRKWNVMLVLLSVLMITASAIGQVRFTQPPPGSVYKEFVKILNGESEFVVVDPNIDLGRYPQAGPVPPPQIPITIDDLSGAVRAEAVVCFWLGHVSTYGKAVRFNSNAWIPLPDMDESNGIPAGHQGYNYLQEENLTLDVPLGQLSEGTNYFQGTNSGQKNGIDGGYGFDWGQWGWYAMVIRVYYDPATKPHATGVISSPARNGNLSEDPTVTANITSGSPTQVDFLAYYDGYDTDGDGLYKEYHHDYNFDKYQTSLEIHNHVGSATSAPWAATWNTSWVPDQDAGTVKVMARIKDNNGTWYVTPEVTGLSLMRTGRSVKLYKPFDTPERCWAKGDVGEQKIHMTIPAGDNLSNASAARYYIRTWNGANAAQEPGEGDWRNVNGWADDRFGQDHAYSYDVRNIPSWVPVSGTNEIYLYTDTYLHHAIEILWPGPALSVEYTGAYAGPTPAVATLAAPANNAIDQLLTLTLKWNPAAAASTYDLQVSTDPGFGTTVVNRTGVTDTTASVGPLSSNSTYYWRVRGVNGAGNSAYSTVWHFATNVGAPSLKSPANNALSQATSLTLSWNSIALATAYRIQVSKDSAFTVGQIVKDTTRTDTTHALAGLDNATKYYWHVTAQTSGSWGAYSPIWNFTTAIAPAAVPTLLSPANNAIDQLTALTLRWRVASGATSYHIQVSSDPTFASALIVDDSTLVDTLRALTSLPYNQQYYWRVSSKNSIGASAYSPVWNFRTVLSVPVGPILLTPGNATSGQITTGLTFQWRAITSASFYRFQLGTDSTFATGLVKNDSSVVDTFRVVSGLVQSTKYFWRVLGRNAGGSGPYSSVWSFTTIVPIPGVVSLIGPANLAVVSADSAIFRWNKPVPMATKYCFQIAVDSSFSLFSSVDSTLTDTVKVFRPLVNSTSYYWRVRGGTSGGWGAYSPTRKFSVVITGIAEQHGVPGNFVLNQNYPNPFNPTTDISFGIPHEARVTLALYNLLGENVLTVVDEVLSAGYHTTRVNADRLPSGIYLYRLTTGDVTLSRKMLLLR